VSASQKLKWKKLLNQLRYFYGELELVEEISTAAAPDFQQYYETFCVKNDIDRGNLNKEHAGHIDEVYGPGNSEGAQKPDEEKTEIDEIFAKLFKKIAFILHPDRLASDLSLTAEEKSERIEMFKRIKNALEEKKYFLLIDCAEKYNVALPKTYKTHTQWMKKELQTVSENITKTTSSYNYMFAECDDDECRDEVIRRFMQQLFQINV